MFTARYELNLCIYLKFYIYIKGKGKVHPSTGHDGPKGEKYSSTLSLTSALDGGGWSTPRPGRFTPEKDPVPIAYKAVWTPGPVWTGAENLATTGIRSPIYLYIYIERERERERDLSVLPATIRTETLFFT